MITGNLNALALAMLPQVLHDLLARPECSLAALQAAPDGRLQPEGASWFCTIGDSETSPAAQRHTEYHRRWLDIQVLLAGEEIIRYDVADVSAAPAEERKPDLFIIAQPTLRQQLHLQPGDFAVFAPGEAHQALCAPDKPARVRKAVFKVPVEMLRSAP
ncbi:YhcH/YjgK/YiaL family protein [Mixta tenebrionis]|uniref:DUF386 domain-containing protein n=1 Tax=Mixta tenebrionis TaxID=2562439 RepID=A0A506VCZ9_9GAMM|nr:MULTISPECIES: YhcH/YjgK/YiaL family protein [Mixta]QHM76656.1 Toxin-antitoxin biofilm protein TabA [Mixta theicola]TPW43924.1 DUF386 domain-containing protein [Mixta tenebrionis]